VVKAKRASLAPFSGPSAASPDVLAAREASAAISPPCSSSPSLGPVEDAEVLVFEIIFILWGLGLCMARTAKHLTATKSN
jgi:hypothetical protein